MSYFTSKALMRNQLKRPENEWLRDTGAPNPQRFYGKLSPVSGLITAEYPLSAGDIVFRDETPEQKYLVLYSGDRGQFFAHEYSKITHTATHKRLDPGTGRDSFGRTTASDPAVIATDVPLSLIGSTSKDDTTKDRAATTMSYSFSCPSRFDIRKGDTLDIDGEVLQIRSILLSSNKDVIEFRATATQ